MSFIWSIIYKLVNGKNVSSVPQIYPSTYRRINTGTGQKYKNHVYTCELQLIKVSTE